MGRRISAAKIALTVFGIMFAALLIFTIHFCYDFGRGFEPQVFRGEEARHSLEGFFSMKLPPSARDLYYNEEGFMDSISNVGITIPPDEAWPFIKKYTGKSRKDFRPLKNTYSSSGIENEKLWDLKSMKKPLYYRRVRGENTNAKTVTSVYYDEVTGRLLVARIAY